MAHQLPLTPSTTTNDLDRKTVSPQGEARSVTSSPAVDVIAQAQSRPTSFRPPPPFVLSSSSTPNPSLGSIHTGTSDSISLPPGPRESSISSSFDKSNKAGHALPSLRNVIKQIREEKDQRGGGSDNEALDTLSASEDIEPHQLHPFDINNPSHPSNHHSPSPSPHKHRLPTTNTLSPHPAPPPFNLIRPSPLSSAVDLPSAAALDEQLRKEQSKEQEQDDMQGLGIAGGPAAGEAGIGSGASVSRSGSITGMGASRPHHGLNALSPLQSFSPLPGSTSPNRSRVHSRNNSGSMSFGQLQPLTITKAPNTNAENRSPEHTRSGMGSAQGSPGSQLGDRGGMRTRTSSSGLTRSLSRRESMNASRSISGMSMTHDRNGSIGGGGAESPAMYGSMGTGGFASGTSTPANGRVATPGGLISKITLVRAPSVGKKDEGFQARHRSKSSGSLTPFTAIPSPALASSASTPSELTRTLSKGHSPQKGSLSRLPGSFSLVGGYGPATTGQIDSGPTSRSLNHVERSNPLNLHEEVKALTPEEIVAMAEMIRSPILAADSDEDNAKPSLSRSSSFKRSGSFRKARTGSTASYKGRMEAQAQAEKEKQQMELEPVEYVEMNDDVLLPFVDRPSEVAELIQSLHNIDIFQIIRPMFPTTSQADSNQGDAWKSIKPYDWTWDEFQKHLLEPRSEVDDFEWVRRARIAVRKHSEAAWERVGTILGCDGDLLSAGEDYGVFGPGGALGEDYNGEEPEPETPGMYADESYGFLGDDDGRGQVCVEGLEAADDDTFSLDRGIREEDHDEEPALSIPRSGSLSRSMSPFGSSMEAVGESDEEQGGLTLGSKRQSKATLTPAQVAAGRGELEDPFGRPSPLSRKADLPDASGEMSPTTSNGTTTPGPILDLKPRSKSFVGLQISTKPSLPVDPAEFHRPSNASFLPPSLGHHPHFERGPGSPLFPTSFSRLSLAPTLPNNNPELKMQRMSFNAQLGENAGMPDVPRGSAGGGGGPGKNWMGIARRKSGSGWSRVSESALTFESEE